MGCTAYQGFCFSAAVPADEAERFLSPAQTPVRMIRGQRSGNREQATA
jgi:hypothetical protein